MLFREYIISKNERHSICIILPVFSDTHDYESSFKMNRFYSRIADVLWNYAVSLEDEKCRKSSFTCRHSVDPSDEGITVNLELSYSSVYGGSRYPTLRKNIFHTWKKKRKGGQIYVITGGIQ